MAAVEALQRRSTFFTSSVAEMVLDGYLHRGADPSKPMKDRLTARASAKWCSYWRKVRAAKKWRVVLNSKRKDRRESHRTNVMRKLDLHSVADLVRYAVRNRIVQVV